MDIRLSSRVDLDQGIHVRQYVIYSHNDNKNNMCDRILIPAFFLTTPYFKAKDAT